MSFTLFSVVVLTVFLLLCLWQIVIGYTKGALASLTRLSVIFFASFVSAILAFAFSDVLDSPILEWIYDTPFYMNIDENFGSLSIVVPFLLDFVISIILYLPIFILVSIIFSLVTALIKRIAGGSLGKNVKYLGEDDPYHEKKGKAIGACVGIVSAFFITVSVFMPFAGTFKAADRIINAFDGIIGDSSLSESESVREYTQYSDDFMLNVIYACGGKTLFDTTTIVTQNGNTSYLNKEIAALEKVNTEKVLDLISNLGVGSNVQIDEAKEILDEARESVMLEAVLIVSVKDAAASWLNGDDYMGVPKPVLADNDAVKSLFDELLYVCTKTSFDTIDRDVMTIINISEIFQSKADLFASNDYQTLIIDLVESGTADRIREEINKNPGMRRLGYVVDDLIMTMIAEELTDLDKFSNEQQTFLYKSIAQSINSTTKYTDDYRVSMLGDLVSANFDSYGIYVPEALNSTIASDLLNDALNASGDSSYELVELFFKKFLAD